MIPLYTYIAAFDENKMRPGFRIQGLLLVLTSQRPRADYLVISPDKCTGHFKTEKNLYLLRATNQEALRYNNTAGGTIELDSKKLFSTFGVEITDYDYSQNIDNMQTMKLFGPVHGFWALSDAAAYQTATGEDDASLLEKFGLPSELEIPTESRTSTSFAEIAGISQQWLKSASGPKPSPSYVTWAQDIESAAKVVFNTQASTFLQKVFGLTAEDVDPFLDTEGEDYKKMALAVISAIQGEAEAYATLAEIFGTAVVATHDPENGDFVDVPSEAATIVNPTDLENALKGNQQPQAEGVPAEQIAEEETAVPSEVVPAEETQLPANTPPTGKLLLELQQLLHTQQLKRLEDLASRNAETIRQILTEAKEQGQLLTALAKIVGAEIPAEDAEVVETTKK